MEECHVGHYNYACILDFKGFILINSLLPMEDQLSNAETYTTLFFFFHATVFYFYTLEPGSSIYTSITMSMKDDMVWNGNKCQPKSKHISQKRGGGGGGQM